MLHLTHILGTGIHSLQSSNDIHSCATALFASEKHKRMKLYFDQTLLSPELPCPHQVYRSQFRTKRRGTRAEIASSLLFLAPDSPHGSTDGLATMLAPASAPESASRGGLQMEAASLLGEGPQA